MRAINVLKLVAAGAVAFSLASCGQRLGSLGPVKVGGNGEEGEAAPERMIYGESGMANPEGSSIWDMLKKSNTDTNVKVNRYIWNASLEVLNFLPVERIDPFTGVIVMGYGRPPGGGQAYRATVYIKDPALDARSLNVALATRGGPVSASTQRAVEDAILNRARQLRIKDKKY
ncbi:DUF3576 domain-containing protein [Rhodalgimonas zhirmunskyi]|uniref:DUF3576 domain-containing protein n=1 Tax=Rhodalgimonas zhirmunskyi TaxID=2964767 RepID=A0AAJ1X5I4_9RHOB|nr:DUF3576 domain-containing protein [Rhodoalgimonas zhirmunskyi]MDQ2094189.1 DUF3576 domain-containing protein [Rhodoalgimonas zhirmunskyi]